MNQPTLPTGARVLGPAHAGVSGTWWRAQVPDGTTQLVLRIATTDPALADRLVATTRAVTALRDPGVAGTDEPIWHNGALWLVSAGGSGSTLSELAESDGFRFDLPQVAAVATETARALGVLHAAGLGHGAVHGRTVLVTGSGTVTLSEAGLLPVLRGTPADPAADRRAWAELVRWMAARWCGGQPGADRLSRYVDLGEQDLAAAVRELRAAFGADAPTEAIARGLPTEALHRDPPTQALGTDLPTQAINRDLPTQAYSPELPTQAFAADAPTEAFTADTRTETFVAGPAYPEPSDDAPTTALSLPSASATGGAAWPPGRPADPWETQGHTYRSTGVDPTATLGGQTPAGQPNTGAPPGGPPTPTGTGSPAPAAEVRFGPGVPTAPPPAPGWQRPQPPPAQPRRSRWRMVGSVLSGLLTLALVIAAGLHLWQRLSPLEVHSVQVAVVEPPGERCDVTVDVAAVVETNGRAGIIEYQWLRSGAEPGALQSQRVGRGQQTVTLRLKWSFSGTGSTTETATINIVEPNPLQAGTEVRYHCPSG